jgi:hypothetical protein
MFVQSINLYSQDFQKRGQITEFRMQTRITNMRTKSQYIIFLGTNQDLGMLISSMVIVYVAITLGTKLQTIFIISEAFTDRCQKQRIITRVMLPYQQVKEGYNKEMLIHLTPYTMNQNDTTILTLDT